MKNLMKYISILLLLTVSLYSAPARGGVLTFTQPDGTTFKGLLKGDSAFHWIESSGQIVMTNPEDGFFYNAKVTKEGKLALTTQKPMTTNDSYQRSTQRSSQNAVSPTQKLDKSSQEALHKLYKASRKGSHPR